MADRQKLAALALLRNFLVDASSPPAPTRTSSSSSSSSGAATTTPTTIPSDNDDDERHKLALSLAAALAPSPATKFDTTTVSSSSSSSNSGGHIVALTDEQRHRRNTAKFVVDQLYGVWPPSAASSGSSSATTSPIIHGECPSHLIGAPLTEPRGIAEAAQKQTTVATAATPAVSTSTAIATTAASNKDALTYGEMDHDSFLGIMDRMRHIQHTAITSSSTRSEAKAVTPSSSAFVDIGSGVCKTLYLYGMVYDHVSECIGVEIIPGLCEIGRNALARLQSTVYASSLPTMSILTGDCTSSSIVPLWVNNNNTNTNSVATKPSCQNSKHTIIFINSTLFPPDLMTSLSDIIGDQCAVHTMIVTFTHRLNHPLLLLCDTIANISWYRSTAYIYRKIHATLPIE